MLKLEYAFAGMFLLEWGLLLGVPFWDSRVRRRQLRERLCSPPTKLVRGRP